MLTSCLTVCAAMIMCCDVTAAMSRDHDAADDLLSTSAVDLVQRHFHCTRLMLVDVADTWRRRRVVDVVQRRLHQDGCPVRVVTSEVLGKGPPPELEPTSSAGLRLVRHSENYVIFSDVDHFHTQIALLRADVTTWNSSAKFLVIASTDADVESTARRLATQLWEHWAYNIAILVSTNFSVEVFTWHPYRFPGCGKRTQEVLLDQWTIGDKRFMNGSSLYRQTPRDLYGCTFTVVTFHLPPYIVDVSTGKYSDADPKTQFQGLEVTLLRVLAAKTGMKVAFISRNKDKWGILLTKGGKGAFQDVLNGDANGMLSSSFGHYSRLYFFDMTSPYTTNAITWFVQTAELIPKWKSIGRIFTSSIWAMICVVLLFVSTVAWRLARNEPSGYRTLVSCTFNFFALLLGSSVARQPRASVLRSFFLLYAFYCLVIDTAYQSSLISFLTEPAYEKQITTEKELVESGFKLGFATGYDDALDPGNPRDKVILSRLFPCYWKTSCMEEVAYEGKMGYLGDKEYMSYIISSRFSDDRGIPMMKSLQENVVTYHVSMILTKGHPLLRRFNKVIGQVNQAGLMSKWKKDVERLAKSEVDVKKPKVTSLIHPVRISLSHLQGAFVLLLLGVASGVVAFVIEICHKMKKTRLTVTI